MELIKLFSARPDWTWSSLTVASQLSLPLISFRSCSDCKTLFPAVVFCVHPKWLCLQKPLNPDERAIKLKALSQTCGLHRLSHAKPVKLRFDIILVLLEQLKDDANRNRALEAQCIMQMMAELCTSHDCRVSSRVSNHRFFQVPSPESNRESSVLSLSLHESLPKFLESCLQSLKRSWLSHLSHQ